MDGSDFGYLRRKCLSEHLHFYRKSKTKIGGFSAKIPRDQKNKTKQENPHFITARPVGMCHVKFPDGQFGSELINGPEIEPQTLPTGILQPQRVSREVYFPKFALFDKRKGGSLNLK